MKEYHLVTVQIFEPEAAIKPYGKYMNVIFPAKISKRCQLHSLQGLLKKRAKRCVRSVNIWCLDGYIQRDMVMANHGFGVRTFMSYGHRLLGHEML